MIDIRDYTIKVTYQCDGMTAVTNGNDGILSFSLKETDNSVKITVKSAQPVKLIMAQLIYEKEYEVDEWFFANGYQSWTTSKEYKKGDRQRGLRNVSNIGIVKTFAAASGDYSFTEYGKDLFHSHTYTYLRRGQEVRLFGTLNDRNGYTVFYADLREKVFAIEKDVEGVTIKGEYELFDIVSYVGSYDEVFDKYFEAYPAKHTGRVGHFAGYTSWYNYFQNITEDIILRDLEGMHSKVGDKANIFQIDDGYESMVGDWLDVDPVKFPRGMKIIADSIHEKGYIAGLWLAPFSAQCKAKLVSEHPDWFIKNPNGKKVIGGFAWNGFYVLDIDKPEVRAYIKNVFDTVFNEWGYDMVKLDFLYSIAILPRNGKSRGRIMHEAMDFLRECCGDKIILGCGVPLGASWGVVDACRISCDVELSFKEKFYTKITNQEIISAKMAMNNTIFRRHLNGRIFANDPDVFFLRDDGMKPAIFTMQQKKLLAKINHMFGDVLFVSDNIGTYDNEKLTVLFDSYKKFDGQVEVAEYIGRDKIKIVYTEGGVKKEFVYNALTGDYDDRVVK